MGTRAATATTARAGALSVAELPPGADRIFRERGIAPLGPAREGTREDAALRAQLDVLLDRWQEHCVEP